MLTEYASLLLESAPRFGPKKLDAAIIAVNQDAGWPVAYYDYDLLRPLCDEEELDNLVAGAREPVFGGPSIVRTTGGAAWWDESKPDTFKLNGKPYALYV